MSRPKPPLWKQLLGAGAGAAIALTLYSGYRFAQPYLQGYLTIPNVLPGVRTSEPVSQENLTRRMARAQRLAQEFASTDEGAIAEQEMQMQYAEDTGTSTETEIAPEWNAEMDQEVGVQEPQTDESERLQQNALSRQIARLFDESAEGETRTAAPEQSVAAATHQGAPALPASGVGLWSISALSLFGASGLRRLRQSKRS